jgi:DNA-binding NarL/FixJ family response regulator
MSDSRPPRHDYLRLLGDRRDRGPTDSVEQGGLAPSADSTNRAVRVLITARHALVRAGYRAVLESDRRIVVVGEAASHRRAVALAKDIRPDVALIDLVESARSDLQASAMIVSQLVLADAAVLLITSAERDDRVLSALRAGAVGLLANDAEASDLIRAVELLAAGKALLPADTVRRLLDELPSSRRPPVNLPAQVQELTTREREVVTLAADGLSTREIADRLVISAATAKTHIGRAMVKLGVHHRAELVVLAYEAGLVARSSGPAASPAVPPANHTERR